MQRLEAGVGKVDISPPTGVELSGHGLYLRRKCRGIHDRLYCRSLILSDNNTDVLLINNDLLGITEETLDRTRKLVKKRLGINPGNVIITSTHTHSGPATIPLRGLGKIDEQYVSSLPDKFLQSAVIANKNKKKARIGFKSKTIEGVSFNRSVKNGPVDRELSILYIRTKGQTFTLFNYACHPVSIDARTEDAFYCSADWPGYAMKTIEEKEGGMSIFLQGPCGNIDPLVAWCMRGFDAAEAIGKRVATKILGTSKEIDLKDDLELEIKSHKIELPLQPFTIERVLKNLAEATKDFLLKHTHTRTRPFSTHVSFKNTAKQVRFYMEWAGSMIKKINDKLPSELNTEIQVLRIGETALIFLPGEEFVELGLQIKRKSPFQKNMVISLSGHYIGYIPTLACYQKKGYDAYKFPMMLGNPLYPPNIGSIIVGHALYLLEKVADKSSLQENSACERVDRDVR